MTGYGEMTPLRRLCLVHRTTRAALAKTAGLSLQTMYNIEAPGARVSDQTIIKIADALGVDPVYVADVLAGRIEAERQAA